MPVLVLSHSELNHRPQQVQEILEPLRPLDKKHRVKPAACGVAHARAFEVIIAAHDGKQPAEYEKWSMSTNSSALSAAYHEHWAKDSASKKWHLDKSYLTIFVKTRPDPTPVLCVHCDPNEPDDRAHYAYKCVPHVHLEAAPSPYPKMHIALYRCCTKKILSSLPAFDAALHDAMLMLRDELLPLDGASLLSAALKE